MERKRDFSWPGNWRTRTLAVACLAVGYAAGAYVSAKLWRLPFDLGDIPTWIEAFATVGLLIGAVITARYAIKAFGKQSDEVRAIERQVQDQEELTRQQAELLRIQSGQLELQREQLDDQRKANALQAEELRDSLTERTRLRRVAEREQADAVNFAWWPAGHVLILSPLVQPPPGTPSPSGIRAGPDRSGMAVLVVDNASRRRILDAACRIEPSRGAGLILAAEQTGQLTDSPTESHQAMLNLPADGSAVPLIRPGSRYGFIFRFDLEKNPDAPLAVRFTDDAGLHWQIDQDLHMQPLDSRGW